jgi:isopenicillin-N N-acyltransferase-like protein
MFPLIRLSGAPYERGVQYGQATAALIRHSIASYARMFAYRRGLDWAATQQLALDYVSLLEEEAPAEMLEMRGIAEGSNLPLATIVALNVRTELNAGSRPLAGAHANYATAAATNRAAGVPEHAEVVPPTAAQAGYDPGECTTLAALPEATANRETLLAQTWDWSGDQRAACVLLQIEQPDGPRVLTLTEAGILAKIGMNSHGLAVTLNILASRHDGEQQGMPVHVLLRRLLNTASFREATAEIQRVRSAASSCITVASVQGELASFELTPPGVGIVEPVEGILAHTNHCVAAATRPYETPLPILSSSEPRYNRAGQLLADGRGTLDRAALIAILRDQSEGANSICRFPDLALHPCDRTESVAAVVFDLAARTMYVAADVPALVEFEPVLVGSF